MTTHGGRLVTDLNEISDVLASTTRMAVLGIKPEYRSPKPAFTVPRYLQQEGYRIVPVPVYYPEVTEILGEPVYRTVSAIPEPVDMVVVFRRPHDIPPHVPDLIAAKPRAVWFQLGIRHADAARTLVEAGMQVVEDRCTAIEHQRLATSRHSRHHDGGD